MSAPEQPTPEARAAAFDALVECERLGRHYSDGEGVMVIEIRTGRLQSIIAAALDRFAAQRAAEAEQDTLRVLGNALHKFAPDLSLELTGRYNVAVGEAEAALAEFLDSIIPVQGAEPTIGEGEGQADTVGRTGGANPPTGASQQQAATPPPGDTGETQMSDLNAPNVMIGVKLVQSRLPQYWTDQSYPDSFNEAPLPHRHFNHSLSHAMKALGGLAALSDAMDHERMQNRGYADPEAEQYAESAGKWLADLVICSARMAEQLHLDLDENVQHRINTLIERWGGK